MPLSSFKNKEVSRIFKTSKIRVKSEFFDIILSPESSDLGRILVITSRKIGNSPQRNRLRRRLKSIFYESKFFNLKTDCIIVAKPGAVNLSFEALKELLNNVFLKQASNNA